MFRSARLKLTAWYLLIIMAISLFFSCAIYLNINSELRRFERFQSIAPARELRSPPRLDPEMIQAARSRLVTTLGILNVVILGLAGTAGYFLAGRTLQPIADMVREQNQFVSDASHELRTPLTSLKSTFEVYLRNKKRTIHEGDNIISESIAEVNKIQSLSDSLLTLTTPHDDGTFSKINTEEIISKAIKNIQPVARKKHITLAYSPKPITITGNMDRLTDLITIILDNAIKYSPPKSTVQITTKKTDLLAIIEVRDEGLGIEKKDIEHIFDRFYRADSARSKAGTGGYGLGLAIAKQIVQSHKGTIVVESEPKKGSSFVVKLPARFS